MQSASVNTEDWQKGKKNFFSKSFASSNKVFTFALALVTDWLTRDTEKNQIFLSNRKSFLLLHSLRKSSSSEIETRS